MMKTLPELSENISIYFSSFFINSSLGYIAMQPEDYNNFSVSLPQTVGIFFELILSQTYVMSAYLYSRRDNPRI